MKPIFVFLVLSFLVVCGEARKFREYEIYWAKDDPRNAFLQNATVNICPSPDSETNDDVFCLGTNEDDVEVQRNDLIVWVISANASESGYGVVATDSTFTDTYTSFGSKFLPGTLLGDTTSELGEELRIEHRFTDAGIFYFRDARFAASLQGFINISDTKADFDDSDDDDDNSASGGVQTYNDILSVITTVLLWMSIAGALMTLFTFTIFPSIRTYPIKLIMYLCTVIVVGFLWFILAFEKTFRDSDGLCFVTGLIVHFFFLANFCWTFCIAFNFYQMIVRRNRESESLEKWYHLFSWGFPTFCAIFVACFEKYGDQGGACYVTDALFIFIFFFLPGLIIISSNAILFFFVAREIHETLASAPKTEKRERKKELRVYISIFISIGLSWIFGFLMVLFPVDYIRLIFLTLFSIFTPLQGFFIFISYCLNAKVMSRYAGLFGKCIPFCRRWENMDSRGSTSTGRTRSTQRSSRSGRTTASSRSMDSGVSTEMPVTFTAGDDSDDSSESDGGAINIGDSL